MADDFHADVAEFKRLFDKSSQVEKKLKTALRKNIREAAKVAADAVKSEVGSGNLRSQIAAGVKVKVMTGNRAGVTIVASSSSMGEGRESLVRAWEAEKGWRHPTFQRASRSARASLRLTRGAHGASKTWVHQMGHPYFRRTIADHRDQIREAVEKAMQEAAESLKG